MGFILTLTAILLSWILFPIGLAYSFIRLMIKAKLRQYIDHWNKLFYTIALSIDQMGNVVLQYILNDTCIQKNGYKFGNPDKTISYQLGENKYFNTLTPFGLFISNVLDSLDENHCIKTYLKEI